MKLRYHGEKRRHNFDTYVQEHLKCQNIFKDLQDYGYSPPDDGTNVRRLIDGIHNKDLQPIKGQVYANAGLANDFGACVTLFKDYIAQAPGMAYVDRDTASIGAVARGGGDGVNWDTSDVQVDLRHHTKEEYSKLSSPQKLKLKRWREGTPDMPRTKATMYNPNHPMAKKMIAAMEASKAKGGGSPKKKQKAAPANKRVTNRNNKALTKQKKAPPTSRGEDDDEAADEE
jgi:hypothetical protein